jgi:hypothetical protein
MTTDSNRYMKLEKIICKQSVMFFFQWRNSPQWGQGILIIRASRSHSDTPHLIGLLWTSDQPGAEASTRQHTTLKRDRQISMPPAGLEPTIPASERPQTHALDRAAAGIGTVCNRGHLLPFNWLMTVLVPDVRYAHLLSNNCIVHCSTTAAAVRYYTWMSNVAQVD